MAGATKLNSKAMSAGTEKGNSYATPWAFVQWLQKNYLQPGTKFTLDPCATQHNAKADMYYNIHQNGLLQPWAGHYVFCNPPHGKGNARKWLAKAQYEVYGELPNRKAKSAYVLLRGDTGATWFQEFAPLADRVIFPAPRINYLHPITGEEAKGNSIAAAVFVFDPNFRNRLQPKTQHNAECDFVRWHK